MADPNVLLVEGPDDGHVFYHFCKTVFGEHIYLRGDKTRSPADGAITLFVNKKDGIEPLLSSLNTELKASDLERLGIVVDADEDVAARWASVRNKLVQFGYDNVPEAPDPNGTIITDQNQSVVVGIWIMPDNTVPGKIENFIRFLLPADDTLWPRAEACLQNLPETERRFTDLDFIKAHVHTWLAWQEEPGVPMGQAITRRFLDTTTPHAQTLADWIARLYGL